MSSEIERLRQMSDKELEIVLRELKTLRKNNEIMTKMLATIENINDLLKNKPFGCECSEYRYQSIDTKVKTKLNVLNKKYIQLKCGLDMKTNHKSKNKLIVIKSEKQNRQMDDSSQEVRVNISDTFSEYQSSGKPFCERPDVESDNKSNEDNRSQSNDCQRVEELSIFDDLEEKRCQFCCEFRDSKTGILCRKMFTTKQTLLTHVLKHTGPKPWFCEESDCEYQAVLRSHLIGHIRKSHTARHQFHCDWPGCDFRGPSRYNVKRHKIIHTNEKPYKCDWPGCEFKSPNNKIAEHKRIHTGEKPYPCHWVGCDARFSRQFTLRNHLRTHTGEKPFKCDYPDCHYSSTQQTPLATHKRKHHNSVKESSEEVVFSDNIVSTDE